MDRLEQLSELDTMVTEAIRRAPGNVNLDRLRDIQDEVRGLKKDVDSWPEGTDARLAELRDQFLGWRFGR